MPGQGQSPRPGDLLFLIMTDRIADGFPAARLDVDRRPPKRGTEQSGAEWEDRSCWGIAHRDQMFNSIREAPSP